MKPNLFFVKVILCFIFLMNSYILTAQFSVGDFKTKTAGSWSTGSSGTATWQRWDGTTWQDTSYPSQNTAKVYIDKTITSNGSIAIGSVILNNGGALTLSSASTINNLLHVKQGGVFNVSAAVTNSGNFIVEDGGVVNILAYSANLWNGFEDFSGASEFNIMSWSVTNTLFTNAASITNSSTTGAKFGQLLINAGAGQSANWTGVFPSGNYKLTQGDLVLNNASTRNITLVNTAGTSLEIGRDFVTNISSTGDIALSAASGNNTIDVRRNLVKNGTGTGIFRMNGAGVFDFNIYGNVNINAGLFRVGVNTSSSVKANVNIQGNLTVSSSGSVNSISNSEGLVNFTGQGTVQLADIAGGYMPYTKFAVKPNAYLRLVNNDFKLGINSNFTVNTGGTLDFGFINSTALNIVSGSNAGATFTSEEGSYLRISSPDGINNTVSNLGNIRLSTAPTISPLASFHYLGKQNQYTGTGIGTTSTGRAVIVEMQTADLKLMPSQSFGITNLARTTINNNLGGILDIRNGQFVETVTEYITGGSTAANGGWLTMATGTKYYIPKESSDVGTDYVPRFYNMNLLGGEINLASVGDQTLRGGKVYKDLLFSKGGVKSISSATTDVENVKITDNTILDTATKSFGKSGTHLIMTDASVFKTGGSSVKPDIGGTYTLSPQTTIEFGGASATQIRLAPNYAQVIVAGTNVSAGTTLDGSLKFQPDGGFTVENGAVFNVTNASGFNGGVTTAINNNNSPKIILKDGSRINYSRSGNQTITSVNADNVISTRGYSNLLISGSGKKTSMLRELYVRDTVRLTSAELTIATSLDNALPNSLTAKKGIKNRGGIVRLENNAQLIQDAGAINIGDVTVERLAEVAANQYNLWASPVVGQSLYNLYPGISAGTVMIYNTTNDFYTPIAVGYTSIFGQGYSIKASKDINNVPNLKASFVGVPNNEKPNHADNIITLSNVNNSYNLVGNPYPSNIDLDALWLVNQNNFHQEEPSTFYFWDNKANLALQQQGSAYVNQNFAMYNASAGQGIAAPNPNATGKIPNGIVKLGQGFIMRASKNLTTPTLTFNNSMRTTEINKHASNAVYYKSASFPQDKYWLELTTPDNMHMVLAVNYYPDAVNTLDRFDSVIFDEDASDNFYSISEDQQKLSIQGRKGDFENTDRVSIGTKNYKEGHYTIKLFSKEGVFQDSQMIYLKDKLLKRVIDLSNEDYKFSALKGIDQSRFEIVYKPEIVLEVDQTTTPSFSIYREGSYLNINSDKALGSVDVYDAMGRLIMHNSTPNKTIKIDTSHLSNGIYIIKAENSGDPKTKKIIK